MFCVQTSALDPLTVGEVEEVIAGLAKKGCTMMLVTHSMEFAHSVSNRVFYMNQGGIYEEGTPDQIFNNPKKERTRRFTRRLACLEIEVSEQSHDLVGEIGRFYPFFSGKGLDIQRIINACKSYEEVCSLMFHEILGDERTFDVILEYDAGKNRLTMSFAPHSLSKPTPSREHIMSQLEYKLINYYSVDKCVEQSDEGIGIRYTPTF